MILRLFGTLSFLATAFVLAAGLTTLAYALATRRRRLARGVAIALGVWIAGYGATLLGVSALSHEEILALGTEKPFCGFDCDLAFSAVQVDTRSGIEGLPKPAGVYYVVSVQARSDAKRVTIQPSDVRLGVVAGDGHLYAPAAELPAGGTRRALLPRTSCVTEVVFDLPADVRDPRLVIQEGGWPTRFVIGDENSFGHPKVVIRLAAPGSV